jgi:rod shape-determining protein MreC
MALASFDRTPPPFFRQGPSALSKLMFLSALALFLMVVDTRFRLTEPIRAAVATVLHPVERVLWTPVVVWGAASDYFMGLQHSLTNEESLRREILRHVENTRQVKQLKQENSRLRGLLDLRAAITVRLQSAEVMYAAPDLFSRKVIIDQGANSDIVRGAPVINDQGVIGQVTRVYALSAEVTLLTDKDAVIPVLNARTQTRGVAFGAAHGQGMDLRFMARNTDVQVGDLLTTSGLDGVYPAGLSVARVHSVVRPPDANFARISLSPVAVPDSVRHVLVVEPVDVQRPTKLEPMAPSVSRTKAKRRGVR